MSTDRMSTTLVIKGDRKRARASDSSSDGTNNHQVSKKLKQVPTEEQGTQDRPIDLTSDDDPAESGTQSLSIEPDEPRSVILKLKVNTNVEDEKNGKGGEKEEKQQTPSPPSFYTTYPTMPNPTSNPYIVPAKIRRRLAVVNADLARHQRRDYDREDLASRRKAWKEARDFVMEQGIDREVWEGGYFEDTDLTAVQLSWKVQHEEKMRRNGVPPEENDEWAI
jgi:hypothetical protein